MEGSSLSAIGGENSKKLKLDHTALGHYFNLIARKITRKSS